MFKVLSPRLFIKSCFSSMACGGARWAGSPRIRAVECRAWLKPRRSSETTKVDRPGVRGAFLATGSQGTSLSLGSAMTTSPSPTHLPAPILPGLSCSQIPLFRALLSSRPPGSLSGLAGLSPTTQAVHSPLLSFTSKCHTPFSLFGSLWL